MPDMHVKVGGVWETLSGVHVKVAGTWEACKTVWVKVAGVWEEVYNSLKVQLNTMLLYNGGIGTNVYSGFKVDSDGTMYKRNSSGTYASQFSWLLNGSNTEVWVKVSKNSGTTPLGITMDTVYACTADRACYLLRTTDGVTTCNVTVYLYADSGGTDELTNRSYTITAERGLL